MDKQANVIEIPKKRGKYGEGSIVQRGDRWQISFYDNEGRRRRQSFSTFNKAKEKLNRLLALRDEGKLDAPKSRTKIDTVAELYLADRKGSAPKSYAWLKLVWDVHLKPFFGGYLASRITTEKLIEYRNERLAAEASPTTVNKELTILRAIFYHGFEDYTPPKVQRVPKFPEKLKEPPPRNGFVTDEQYESLQAQAKQGWLRAFLAIAYTFGFRKSELLGLRVKQINMKERTIRLLVGETKNNEGRVVKMTQEVHGFLPDCIRGKTADDYVFTWKDGSPVRDLRGTWAALTKAAGVFVLLHDFRRSAVKNMSEAEVDRDVAKRISGHKTDSIFTRYNIVDSSRLVEATAKLEARRSRMKLVSN